MNSLTNYSQRGLQKEFHKMNNYKDFFDFLKTIKTPHLLDYMNHNQMYKNIDGIIQGFSHFKGPNFRCNPSRFQFENGEDLCHNPNIFNNILPENPKKIGADSANGIVFLVKLNNFKFILKTALLKDADPLDYELHIQMFLNPLRQIIPNYSLGFFPIICKGNKGLKMKERITNNVLVKLEEEYEEEYESYGSASLKEIRKSKPIKGRLSEQQYQSVERDIDKIIANFSENELSTLYRKLMNTFDSINHNPLCIVSNKEIKQGKRQSQREAVKEKGEDLALFIATEFTENHGDLGGLVENKKYTDEMQVINILLQVYCALQVGMDKHDFTHYDLHAGNVLITKLDKPVILVYHFPNHPNMPFVPIYTEYLATLIDFGRSYVKEKKMYFDPEEKDKEWLFTGDPCWNMTLNKSNFCYDMLRLTFFIASDIQTPRFLRIMDILFDDFGETFVADDSKTIGSLTSSKLDKLGSTRKRSFMSDLSSLSSDYTITTVSTFKRKKSNAMDIDTPTSSSSRSTLSTPPSSSSSSSNFSFSTSSSSSSSSSYYDDSPLALCYPHNRGKTIKNPIDLIAAIFRRNRVTRSGGLIPIINYQGQEDIYLLNAGTKSGLKQVSKDDFDGLQGVIRLVNNFEKKRINDIAKIFKNKAPQQGGKGRKRKNPYIRGGGDEYDKMNDRLKAVASITKRMRKRKLIRPKKQGGGKGKYNNTHDVKESVISIQKY